MHENNGYIWQLEKAPKTVDFISINRTLLVQKLTDNTPIRPIIVRGLTSIEAVFAHFKPKVNIEFKDNQGNIHFETLRFTSIEDFGKKGIVKQSHFLQSQNSYSEDDLQELLRQLRANIALRKILEDVDAKEAFLAVIRIMMDELLDFSIISSSTFHDLLDAGIKQQDSTDQNSREDANHRFNQSIKIIFKYGGFGIVEKIITGASNLNPVCQAHKKAFLFNKENKIDRDQLHRRLHLWHNILFYNNFIPDAIDKIKQHVEDNQRSLFHNLKMAIEATHELEQAYRSVALFFQNANQIEVKNISFLNADKDQLQDLDNTVFINAVGDELAEYYDRLNLLENYSLLVVPGYLGSNRVVDKWAKLAHSYKAMLITDFENLRTQHETTKLFNVAKLVGSEVFKSNVVMTANWFLGRDRLEEINEVDDLFVPPSSALAGRIHSVLALQLTSGGCVSNRIQGVENVSFRLNLGNNYSTEPTRLVWMAGKDDYVTIISEKTLFENSDNCFGELNNVVQQDCLHIISVNYIAKSMINIINLYMGDGHFYFSERLEAQNKIIRLLKEVTGPNKIIKNFAIRDFKSFGDWELDRIKLDIYLTPTLPTKTFVLSIEGYASSYAERYLCNPSLDWEIRFLRC